MAAGPMFFYITLFANLHGDKRDFLGVYGYQGAAFKSLLAEPREYIHTA